MGKKKRKPRPNLRHEEAAGYPARVVAGADEVGRGCLAGPVVAGAVVLPPPEVGRPAWVARVRDSKLLSAEERAELAPLIRGWVRTFAVAEASVEEIDRINILQASYLAMRRALAALSVAPEHILVDGKFAFPAPPCPATSIVKGDQKCLSVACASILAKVHRDEQMRCLHVQHPHYAWDQNKGYPTAPHRAGIRAHGLTSHHRRSFQQLQIEMDFQT